MRFQKSWANCKYGEKKIYIFLEIYATDIPHTKDCHLQNFVAPNGQWRQRNVNVWKVLQCCWSNIVLKLPAAVGSACLPYACPVTETVRPLRRLPTSYCCPEVQILLLNKIKMCLLKQKYHVLITLRQIE